MLKTQNIVYFKCKAFIEGSWYTRLKSLNNKANGQSNYQSVDEANQHRVPMDRLGNVSAYHATTVNNKY